MVVKPSFNLKVIRKKYKEGLAKGNLRAIYSAYSKFNERAYHYIQSTAPVSNTPSKRFPAGFVKGHIQLVTKRRPPYTYQEVDVPGKHSPRSRAWRTWVIINVLHSGWESLPFIRKPTRRRAMGLPVIQGGRLPEEGESKIAAAKAIQRRQIRLNPWITRTWEAIQWEYHEFLLKELEKQPKETETQRMKKY